MFGVRKEKENQGTPLRSGVEKTKLDLIQSELNSCVNLKEEYYGGP